MESRNKIITTVPKGKCYENRRLESEIKNQRYGNLDLIIYVFLNGESSLDYLNSLFSLMLC